MDSCKEDSPPDACDRSQKAEQNSRENSGVVTSSEVSLSSSNLTPFSEAIRLGNAHGNNINCIAAIEPNNQVVALHPPSSWFNNRSKNDKDIPTEEAAMKISTMQIPRTHLHISEDGRHDSDSSIFISAPPIGHALTYTSRTSIPVSSCSSLFRSYCVEQYITDFQHLDSDSEDLIKVLVFLGQADVSESMLSRGCQPRRFWSSAGEISEELASSLIPVLTIHARLMSAIERLKHVALIDSKANAGPLSGRSFSVNSSIQQHIRESIPYPSEWKVQAMKLVLHTFPVDAILEPYL